MVDIWEAVRIRSSFIREKRFARRGSTRSVGEISPVARNDSIRSINSGKRTSRSGSSTTPSWKTFTIASRTALFLM